MPPCYGIDLQSKRLLLSKGAFRVLLKQNDGDYTNDSDYNMMNLFVVLNGKQRKKW